MRASKRCTLLKRHYFAVIGSFSVKMVADRYRHAAYLSLEMLHNVFYAIIVSKITYAISSWYSFLALSLIHI